MVRVVFLFSLNSWFMPINIFIMVQNLKFHADKFKLCGKKNWKTVFELEILFRCLDENVNIKYLLAGRTLVLEEPWFCC